MLDNHYSVKNLMSQSSLKLTVLKSYKYKVLINTKCIGYEL